MTQRDPIQAELESGYRSSTVGFGNTDFPAWHFVYRDYAGPLSEGFCPGCRVALVTKPLLTYHHKNAELWGCCPCCHRGWLLEVRDDPQRPYVVSAADPDGQYDWLCDHPLPNGQFTMYQHASRAPALMAYAAGEPRRG